MSNEYKMTWLKYEDLWQYLKAHFGSNWETLVPKAAASLMGVDKYQGVLEEEIIDFIIENNLLDKPLDESLTLWKLSYE